LHIWYVLCISTHTFLWLLVKYSQNILVYLLDRKIKMLSSDWSNFESSGSVVLMMIWNEIFIKSCKCYCAIAACKFSLQTMAANYKLVNWGRSNSNVLDVYYLCALTINGTCGSWTTKLETTKMAAILKLPVVLFKQNMNFQSKDPYLNEKI